MWRTATAFFFLLSFFFFFFFFFSSRRRHTRFKCDWSSDVCSSDLRTAAGCRPWPCRLRWQRWPPGCRSEEHTSELQSHLNLVCRLLLEKKKNMGPRNISTPRPSSACRPYTIFAVPSDELASSTATA